MIFDASSAVEAVRNVGGLFGAGGIPFMSESFLYYLRSYAVVLVIGMIAATPLFKTMLIRLSDNKKIRYVINLIEIPVTILLLLTVTGYLVDGSFNPFLYFRF